MMDRGMRRGGALGKPGRVFGKGSGVGAAAGGRVMGVWGMAWGVGGKGCEGCRPCCGGRYLEVGGCGYG